MVAIAVLLIECMLCSTHTRVYMPFGTLASCGQRASGAHSWLEHVEVFPPSTQIKRNMIGSPRHLQAALDVCGGL